MRLGSGLSFITVLNIHGKRNRFHAHPFPAFSIIAKRFVIPRNEITILTGISIDIENQGFSFFNGFLSVVLRRCLKMIPLLKCQ
jgi:hypothetical protein